jgi:two-component system, chemotaxis family, sensor kinase CheA
MAEELKAWQTDIANRDCINVLMRSTHSFKANARTFGIGMLQAAAHAMEDDVVLARDGDAEPTLDDLTKVEKHMTLITALVSDCKAFTGDTTTVGQLSLFLGETQPLLRKVTEQAAKWRKELSSRAELDALFRFTHSYKAVARKFQFSGMVTALHAIEDRLEQARQMDPITPEFAKSVHVHFKELTDDLSVYESVGRQIATMDQAKQETFSEECRARHLALAQDIKAWKNNIEDQPKVNAIFRTMHSLKAYARTYAVVSLQNAVHAIEDRLDVLREREETPSENDFNQLASRFRFVVGFLGDVPALAQAAVSQGDEDTDKITNNVTPFAEEARHLLSKIDEQSKAWEATPTAREALDTLFRTVHSCKATARRFNFSGFEKMLHSIEDVMDEARQSEPIDVDLGTTARKRLQDLGALLDTYEGIATSYIGQVGTHSVAAVPENVRRTLRVSRASLFAQEAQSLYKKIDQHAQAWSKEPAERSHLDALFRVVHSFKALAARMKFKGLQAFVHGLEDRLDAARLGAGVDTSQAEPCARDMKLIGKLIETFPEHAQDRIRLEASKNIVGDFARESDLLLTKIVDSGRAWAATPDEPGRMDALFRFVHSFKACTRRYGMHGIEAFVHAVENTLDTCRDGQALDDGARNALVAKLQLFGENVTFHVTSAGELMSVDEAQVGNVTLELQEKGTRTMESIERWALKPADTDLLNSLFRVVHSFKAEALGRGLAGLGAKLHICEDTLTEIRDQSEAPCANDANRVHDDFQIVNAVVRDLEVLGKRTAENEDAESVEELLEQFLEESHDRLGAMKKTLTQWHKDVGNRDFINALLRTMHSLKANARTFGMSTIEGHTHTLEDRLVQLRDGQQKPKINDQTEVETELGLIQALLADTEVAAAIDEQDSTSQPAPEAPVHPGPLPSALVEFLREAPELVSRIIDEASKWKSNPKERTHLDALFREVHSLKACARRFAYSGLVGLLHGLEDVLEAAREEETPSGTLVEDAGSIIRGLKPLLWHYAEFSAGLQNIQVAGSAAMHFVTEARGLLIRIDESAERWANEPNHRDHLDALFRVVHSYKACAGRYKFKGLEALVHRLEDDLDAARSGPGVDASQAVPMQAKTRSLSHLVTAYQTQDQGFGCLNTGHSAIGDFVREAASSLAKMSEAVAEWGENPDDKEKFDSLFRLVHSFKACCGRYRLGGIEAAVHKLEDRLDAIQQGSSTTDALQQIIKEEIVLFGEMVNLHRSLAGNLLCLPESRQKEVMSVIDKRHGVVRECLDNWLQEATDLERLNALFRVVHSYKAQARNAKLDTLHEGLHSLEDLLCDIRDGESKPTVSNAEVIERRFALFDSVVADLSILGKRTNENADDENDHILEQFVEESQTGILTLERCLSAWKEDVGNIDHIHVLFRTMHSFKANARTFGVRSVQSLTHTLEDQLMALREKAHPPTLQDLLAVELRLGVIVALVQDAAVLSEPVQQEGDREEVLEQFVEECLGRNQQFSDIMVAWRENPGERDFINRLFRTIHSFKANARSFGAQALQDLAHALEDELDALRIRKEAPTWKTVVGMGARIGEIQAMTVDCVELGKAPQQIDDLEQIIDQFVEDSGPRCDTIREGLDAWASEPNTQASLNALFRAVHSLKAEARACGLPPLHSFVHRVEDALDELRESEEAITAIDVERVSSHARQILSLIADLGNLLTFAKPADEAKSGKKKHKRQGKTTKVPQARIMDLRKDFKELTRFFEDEASVPDELAALLQSIGLSVQALTQVPLADLFERFRKMVFDLGVELGKRVNDLQVTGEDIYVDTKLIEKMRDVLIHALRNCLDHGIETPDERPGTKPEKGTISIDCSWDESDLVIKVGDDGRGVNLNKVKEKAYQKGFFEDKDLDSVAQNDVIEMLFRPGFSMAAKVTDVSGRGVGMDVIRSTMRELKGEASLETSEGEATTLTLRIPADYYQAL